MPLPELAGRIEKTAEPDVDMMRREIDDLTEQLENAQEEISSLREATLRLSRLLGPVYRALQAAIGEVDVPDAATTTAPAAIAGTEFWDRTKARLGGTMAIVIDVLLGHPGMSTTAVAVAAHCRVSTASTLLSRLKFQNLVEKKGQLWVLKSL